jgi:predicted dehydrogenase
VRRIGLIGCGRIVQRTHALAYHALRGHWQIVAAADVSEAALEEAGTRFGILPTHRYRDYRDMLERASIDTVVIATPHAFHAEQAIAAAQAGKTIISEKPMATTLEEANAILAAVRRAGVAYTVVHNFLFTAAAQGAAQLLAEGVVGEPILGHGELIARKPDDTTRPELDWRASQRFGGGCVIDTAYHEIYMVERLMGSPVRYVEARVATLRFPIDVDDTALLLLEHANGRLSTVHASWCARAPALSGRWVVVQGTHGAVRVVHNSDIPLTYVRDPERNWEPPEPHLLGATAGVPGDRTGHAAFFQAVARALDAGGFMSVTGEEAQHILAIVLAAREASAARRAGEVATQARAESA